MIVNIILIILLNILVIKYISEISKFVNLYDLPDNNRKLHTKKIAPIGGVIIFSNITLFFSYNFFFHKILDKFELFLFSSLIFLIGFIDDKFKINANFKFFLFIIFGLLLFKTDNNLIINELNFSFLENSIYLGKYSLLFSVFSLVIFLNAFNMFDGINLQSSIYGIFIFIVFILNNHFLNLSLVLVVGLIFFLYLNYKNICFLGDNGSLLVSFLIAYIFFQSSNEKIFFADEILLIMIIPGIDLIRLFFLRLINKKSPFTPDNNHLHHYLIKKFGLIKTNFYVFLLITLPYFIGNYFENYLLLILISILIYFFILILLKRQYKML